MGEEIKKKSNIYFRFKRDLPLYKKIWYRITFRKDKLYEYREAKIMQIGE